MRRRRLLALCGSLLAGAGCQQWSNDTETVTPVPSPGSGGTRTDEVPETPAKLDVSAAVQPGFVAMNTPDSIGVYDDAGQYLVGTVDTIEGTPPDPTAFRFHFDGTAHEPVETGRRRPLFRSGELGGGYADGSGVLVFGLPETGDGSDARLSWPGGEWPATGTVRDRLAAPLPSFDVSLDGPTVVPEGEDPTLELSVTNVGDVAGRYVLALNRTGPRIAYAPVRRFSGVLEPGATDRLAHDAKSPLYIEGDSFDVTYRLDAPGRDNDTTHHMHPAETKTAEETGTATPTDA